MTTDEIKTKLVEGLALIQKAKDVQRQITEVACLLGDAMVKSEVIEL